jgi:hypothetical protein
MSKRVWLKWVVAALWVFVATGKVQATEAPVAGDAYVNSALPPPACTWPSRSAGGPSPVSAPVPRPTVRKSGPWGRR